MSPGRWRQRRGAHIGRDAVSAALPATGLTP